MRRFLFLLIVLASAPVAADTLPAPAVLAAAAAPDTIHGEKGDYLIGPLTRAQWLAFAPALREEYAAYHPDPQVVEALAAVPRDITLVCVLGTWCGDSRREVPRLWKVLDAAANPGFTLLMFAAGRTGDAAAAAWERAHGVVPGYRQRFGAERVPTIVVLEDGREIGRIVETPAVSLEADLAAILDARAAPRWH